MGSVVHVVPAGDGVWAVAGESMDEGDGPTFATAEEAEAEARRQLEGAGGGELIVHRAGGDVGEKLVVGVVDTTQLDG